MTDPVALERVAEAIRTGSGITTSDLEALCGAWASRLDEDQLHCVSRQLALRLPNAFPGFELGDALRLYLTWVTQEGGYDRHLHPNVVDELLTSARDASEPPLHVRQAFGLISREHVDALYEAIRDGVGRKELLAAVYDGSAVQELVGARASRSITLRFAVADLNGMPRAPDEIPRGGEEVSVSAGGVELRLLVGNEAELCQAARVERSTADWLARTVGPGSVVIDVGANIGLYSILALRLGAKAAIACEPAPENHRRLVQNLRLNQLDASHAFPVAVANRSGLTAFGMTFAIAGGWSHAGLDSQAAASTHVGCVSMTLDEISSQLEGLSPTHLKVDVDGFELEVLEGGAKTLGRSTLRHVLVETVVEQLPRVAALLAAHGFTQVEPGIEVFGNCFFERR